MSFPSIVFAVSFFLPSPQLFCLLLLLLLAYILVLVLVAFAAIPDNAPLFLHSLTHTSHAHANVRRITGAFYPMVYRGTRG